MRAEHREYRCHRPNSFVSGGANSWFRSNPMTPSLGKLLAGMAVVRSPHQNSYFGWIARPECGLALGSLDR